LVREVDRSAYFTAPIPAAAATLSSSAGSRSGAFCSMTARRADRGVQQRFEPHRAAVPGLERPPVRPEHRAERDVHRLDRVGQPAGAPRRLPDHPQVQRLARADGCGADPDGRGRSSGDGWGRVPGPWGAGACWGDDGFA
jgi:hypothetical protein